jgi:hypothetical protein
MPVLRVYSCISMVAVGKNSHIVPSASASKLCLAVTSYLNTTYYFI